ncbi:MAG: ThiF family adenylyltransferase [Deltaproteobacteria bacterium]|nr:ThiF family adenylyltransferase [Deltaproteobacteria bacterium]
MSSVGSIIVEALTSSSGVTSVTELHKKQLSADWAKERGIAEAYQLNIEVNGNAVTLIFGIKSTFPLSLPCIFLNPWDMFGIIPHVEDDGYICFAQVEGLLLISENIGGIVQESLTRAINVLNDGMSGKNQMDFLDEFGAYWDRQFGIKTINSFVAPSNLVKPIKIVKNDKKWNLLDDVNDFKRFFRVPVFKTIETVNAAHGIYVPLKKGTVLIPPHPNAFWTLLEIRQLVFDNIEDSQHSVLETLLKKCKCDEVILFSLPRLSIGETLFCIRFKGIPNKIHPLLDGRASEIVPMVVKRYDKEHMLPRGGSTNDFRSKKVLLLGCGSVGGFIATELTRAGISTLTAVDMDVLKYENIFRHVLGRNHINRPKVEGIKKDIESRLPFTSVTPVCKSLSGALESGDIKLADFDLIISALGSPTDELDFNEYIRQVKAPPVVFTWLEPHGIGGHALVTNQLSVEKGCLSCLYGKSDNETYCRAAFAAKNQVFAKNIDGCRSAFTPFGSLDAVKTSELATRLAIEVLKGEISKNMVRSWRGDSREFVKNGFKLSDRYLGTTEHFIEDDTFFVRPDCNVCHR